MIYDQTFRLRISRELLDYCRSKPNASRFVRSLIRYEQKRRASPKMDTLSAAPEIRVKTPYTFFAKMIKIVDGDTIVLDADLGFYVKAEVRVRLTGVNVPPPTTAKGKKAAEFLESRLSYKNNLVVESRRKDKYGRYLAYIYYHRIHTKFEDIVRLGKVVNEELLINGLAEKYED